MNTQPCEVSRTPYGIAVLDNLRYVTNCIEESTKDIIVKCSPICTSESPEKDCLKESAPTYPDYFAEVQAIVNRLSECNKNLELLIKRVEL